MAKVDIYHYSSATDVTSVTLSNCDSTTPSDYAVMIQQELDTTNSGYINYLRQPHAISGTTMTLQNGGAVAKCKCIMVTQKG